MAEDSIASASALELDMIALFYYLHIVVLWIPHGGQDSVGRRTHVVNNLDVELCKI
jgi:hypothetical protein